MSRRGWIEVLRAGTALGLLVAVSAEAYAGGFAVREQSTYGQGSSFAGIAAGGSLSSMFWNPATMTQFGGIQTEASVSGIIPYAAHQPLAGSTLLPLGFGGTSDTAKDALVPSAYASWQINPNLWLGLSVNSPFGLSTGFPNVWAGRDYAANDSSLKTYNATPSFAYRFNDLISVGAGVQIQYAKATLNQGITAFPNLLIKNLDGNGWGYGFTAGVTLTPTPTTSIGVGYRSAINQKIDAIASASLVLPPTPVSTTVRLPDMVSVGLRQRVGPQLTLLGTVEWTNWSRIGTSNVVRSNGALLETLPFQFEDGWFFSVGAEYQWTDRLAVRGGIAWEKSPITDQVRMPLLPDNDRTWLSVGASYHISRDLVADLAYSHLWVRDTSVNISAASGNPWFNPAVPIAYVGDVSAHVDLISIALKYRWDDAAPARKSPLITK
jgi:long-chain fatty acid transport protein